MCLLAIIQHAYNLAFQTIFSSQENYSAHFSINSTLRTISVSNCPHYLECTCMRKAVHLYASMPWSLLCVFKMSSVTWLCVYIGNYQLKCFSFGWTQNDSIRMKHTIVPEYTQKPSKGKELSLVPILTVNQTYYIATSKSESYYSSTYFTKCWS